MLLASTSACVPNPRNQIGDIASRALREIARTSGADRLCVQRTIMPWQPAATAGRIDPPAPPGFAGLYGGDVFRGGGGLKGATSGGLAVGGELRCLQLAGPLIDGDLAMIEARDGDSALNSWLRRDRGGWHVVMTTTSAYRR